MDAILKFKEAAKAFQQDDRYLAFSKAREANDNDKTLQGWLEEFNTVRNQLNAEIEKEDRDEEKLKTMNSRVNELYMNIMGSDTMSAYNKAKEDIEGFMTYVNAILNAAIDGEDPMQVEEPTQDCSGSCSSCSGCG